MTAVRPTLPETIAKAEEFTTWARLHLNHGDRGERAEQERLELIEALVKLGRIE